MPNFQQLLFMKAKEKHLMTVYKNIPLAAVLKGTT